MKEQKVVITGNHNDINDLIAKGWDVVSVTAQHVATSVSTGNTFGKESILKGGFCFVMERKR